MEGIVIRGLGGLYEVLRDGRVYECRGRGGLKRDRNILYVGDRVEFDQGAIGKILPRRNVLPRPPVANLDKLFIVVALSDPLPNLYTLDKLIVISEHCGIEPVLVLNKTDLEDPLSVREIYSSVGYPSFSVCAKTGENVDLLRDLMRGRTCAFAGLSGVGKSTLMNALAPNFVRQTGEISRKLQRGKHTTRAVELYPFEGGFLADTPGFSELEFSPCGLHDRSLLADYFPEFEPYSDDCFFRDCAHGKEKGCAVRAAVEEGRISRSRYENYLRMYEEIGPLRPWETTK
ncbi:MAG: ribosome small subunit-dependent GTPase A [Clostridia bacterium]|nr:ribosome small subunit-dependent GTPase A [Clostridia bacterium]